MVLARPEESNWAYFSAMDAGMLALAAAYFTRFSFGVRFTACCI
jgi:hypothetical protein